MVSVRCIFYLASIVNQIRLEVLHFSKTSLNSFRFWRVMITTLSVWAYFFPKMSHLSASGLLFPKNVNENITPLSVWAYTSPKMTFSVTPLRVRAWARMLFVFMCNAGRDRACQSKLKPLQSLMPPKASQMGCCCTDKNE